ncbi:hypothetical protein BHE90_016704 [Fusarium euwallaceae]|uniref:Uncharacterized protein n=1 Tax=Fusarium euwallaceae TaxID=1147111 RepID=A0A430KZM8_9HYPO|nr:hypothetical protein BHE90_016704 [Fusarium euwallaceae]
MRSSLNPTTTISTQSTLTESHFEGFTQFCFFAAFQPQKFAEKAAYLGRKTEISHIITHAIDHHGLIRCSQGNHDRRKYITVCRSDRQLPSSATDCPKCRKVQTWEDGDFEDGEHAGNAICLRCWRSFTKRELNAHLKGPPCSYNAEQPKARKVMILYTTFCSDSKPPTQPPRQASPGQLRKRKRTLEPPPLCNVSSPVTTTPVTLTIQRNEDLAWPFSLKKMKIYFILHPHDGS